jgi:hypothetical protein
LLAGIGGNNSPNDARGDQSGLLHANGNNAGLGRFFSPGDLDV